MGEPARRPGPSLLPFVGDGVAGVELDVVLAACAHHVVEAEGFDLDDVKCASGQYDIMLDADYAVTDERKE